MRFKSISHLFTQIKLFLKEEKKIIKQPRKKIENQLFKNEKILSTKMNELQTILNNNDLEEKIKQIGYELLLTGNEFIEIGIIERSKIILKKTLNPLLEIYDFPLWVNTSISSLIIKITIFINNTMESEHYVL